MVFFNWAQLDHTCFDIFPLLLMFGRTSLSLRYCSITSLLSPLLLLLPPPVLLLSAVQTIFFLISWLSCRPATTLCVSGPPSTTGDRQLSSFCHRPPPATKGEPLHTPGLLNKQSKWHQWNLYRPRATSRPRCFVSIKFPQTPPCGAPCQPTSRREAAWVQGGELARGRNLKRGCDDWTEVGRRLSSPWAAV